ncbi:hypothetical protein L5515_013098 [Caenorhabditis briggsae]|uniref:Uncharacterized protein n=1 Tax=Caenorhabditis briggsae TaxID=6238 RepID=A0AAE9E879_CAEBR|nr:hypothetical protein L5515_013098 [Caenorhabditis briggsae]
MPIGPRMVDPVAQPPPETTTVPPNLCCGFLGFLFCGENSAKVQPIEEASERSQESQNEDSNAPEAPEAAPESTGVLPNIFTAIKEKVIGTSDPAHSEKTHPTRIIPINETTPEPRHEFDDWHLGEARAPEIRITAENAKEHQEKLLKILHGYDCRQKYMARLQLILQGHLISPTSADAPVDPSTPPLVEPLFVDFNGNPFLPMPDIHPLPDWRNFVPDRLREHLQSSIHVAVKEKAMMIEENAFLASATRGEYYARLALEIYEYNLPESEKFHAAPDPWQSQTPLATRHQQIMKLFIVINQDPFPPGIWSLLDQYALGHCH